MEYQFYLKPNYTNCMTERNSRSRITYYTNKKMEEMYPEGGYRIIGEIGNFARKYAKQDVIITDTGKRIPIFPRGSLKKPVEWVAGCAAVEENTYVSVVKSIIPHWLRILTYKRV